MKFIPIDWKVARNNYHVNIDCYIINEKGKEEILTEICQRIVDGCNLEPLHCDASKGIRVQVLDSNGTVMAQSKWEKDVQRIVIDKDEFLNMTINFEK